MREKIILYQDYKLLINTLSRDEKGEFLECLLDLFDSSDDVVNNDVITNESENVKNIFSFIKNRILDGEKKFKKFSKLGKKGMANRYNLAKQSEAVVNNDVITTLEKKPNEVITKKERKKEIKINNIKENILKEKNKKQKEIKIKLGEYGNVKLKQKEINKLQSDFGEEIYKKYLKILDEGIQMNSRKYNYTDHNLAFRKWLDRDGIKTKIEAKRKNFNFLE